MVSNDVLGLEPGGSCEALLLTPKARVIAALRVVRRASDDFLLLTEPELGEIVRNHLLRGRLAARCEVELEEHASHLLLGGALVPPEGALSVHNGDYGVAALEVLDAPEPSAATVLDEEALERLRIEAGRPRFGREIDDRVLPAEAGLDERAVSFSKGCYPGQEPVARLRHRGHVNRSLRVLRIEAAELPPYDAEIEHEGKAVGRVTSAVAADGSVVALGYVREEVPLDAVVSVNGAAATMSRPRP
jgi:folate-binding protein YgfZ